MPLTNVRLFTIGVYGKTEPQFFNQLAAAHIDTFCDIRNRRGMRGPLYAFANSQRLQTKLGSLGISYHHFKELAPSDSIRGVQSLHDEVIGVQKRSRIRLSEEFKRLYREECLAHFNSTEFVGRLGPGSHNVVLFCVEAQPAACHRLILADQLSGDLGVPITHL
jgi:uncharacterized protein (DUF488 family)